MRLSGILKATVINLKQCDISYIAPKSHRKMKKIY